jgi:hypothetical protein
MAMGLWALQLSCFVCYFAEEALARENDHKDGSVNNSVLEDGKFDCKIIYTASTSFS